MNGQLALFGGHNSGSGGTDTVAQKSVWKSFEPPEVLIESLHTAGLSYGRVRLAAEFAELEPALSDPQRRALFIATILGLEAQAQGSTFVPVFDGHGFLKRRLESLVPEELSDAEEQWKPDRLVDELRSLLKRDDLELVGGKEDWKPIIISEGRLYHQRMMLHETRLVEAVASRIERGDVTHKEDHLAAALQDVRHRQPPGRGGEPMKLSAEQEYALLTALHRPLTLITGGPGTGKTSIVVSLLRMMVRLGTTPGSLALAAPTGKAANRMAESIYGQLRALDEPSEEDRALMEALEAPKTLHRLMGYSPRRDRFAHHGSNPLPYRMVVVDEASMIDLFLMERLFGAVSSTAQLVLLGDADQLPSVDTGAVLRDLVPSQTSTNAAWRQLLDDGFDEHSGTGAMKDAAVRLERSYRMRAEDPAGREILTLAQSIRDYDDDEMNTPQPRTKLSTIKGNFEGVCLWEPDSDDAHLTEFVEWWFNEVILASERRKWVRRFNAVYQCDKHGRLSEDAQDGVRQLIGHFLRARILTLTRVLTTGAEELNRRFHRKMAQFGRGGTRDDYRFYPGEPVMMLRNDYERDLFNGDQGVVVWCRSTDEPSATPIPTAVFERSDGLVAYSIAELGDDLEHAFAMTVHKAQGSEFERVALILPTEPMVLLNRELLYTGLTRASRGVLIGGAQSLLEYGAAHRTERFSGVGEKLEARMDS